MRDAASASPQEGDVSGDSGVSRPGSSRTPSNAATERGFVIERYVYTNRRGNDSGVQWLVHEERDGNRHLVKVCKTRREAKAYVRAVL